MAIAKTSRTGTINSIGIGIGVDAGVGTTCVKRGSSLLYGKQ